MELFVIGQESGDGPVAIGITEDAKARLAELQASHKQPLKLLREKKLARGWDGLADTILRRELAWRSSAQNGWYRVNHSRAKSAADKAWRATQITKREQERTNFGPLITHIRTTIFGCSMEVLATIADTATSTVSRWEKGELQPGLDEIRRLRAFAAMHGLAWKDQILFEETAP